MAMVDHKVSMVLFKLPKSMGAVFLHLPGGSVGSSKVNLSKYLSTRAIGMCWIKKQRVLIPYLHWCVFYRRMNSLSEEWMVRDKCRRLQSSTKPQIHARVFRRHNFMFVPYEYNAFNFGILLFFRHSSRNPLCPWTPSVLWAKVGNGAEITAPLLRSRRSGHQSCSPCFPKSTD